jgi:hypothetical protein
MVELDRDGVVVLVLVGAASSGSAPRLLAPA